MGTSESRLEQLGSSVSHGKFGHNDSMDRLRRSLRDSFRRRKDRMPECSKPHQWQDDEQAVRNGTCNFHVKYLGCVEVFESRGMGVCEEALKLLKNTRRRVVKGVLHVSGDGLRVVGDETKGLIVDQTIEKVSFCAPDRYHERGFSYICRDGATRRWMCHGFLATRESGERLSHAVGCAFAVCLERKQKREKEAGVAASFDLSTSTFTRIGSFRITSLTERMSDPQEHKPTDKPPLRPVVNPYAIERPHATPHMLQRQLSFRGFSTLNEQSPFKRQLSMNIGERIRSHSLDDGTIDRNIINGLKPNLELPKLPEVSNSMEPPRTCEALSQLAQQVTKGLALLSSQDDPFSANSNHSVSKTNALFKDSPEVSVPAAFPSEQLNASSANLALSVSSRNIKNAIPFQRSQTLDSGVSSTNPFSSDLSSPNNPFINMSLRSFEVHL